MLVVLHGDGWVELYADRRQVRAVTVLRPLDTDETANLTDAWIESQIPAAHAALYCPSGPNLLATGQCRAVAAEQLLAARENAAVIRALLAIAPPAARQSRATRSDQP